MANLIEKIIESARANTTTRKRDSETAEQEANREIATLQRFGFMKKTRDDLRNVANNFKNDIADYSVDALLPNIAIKIRQGDLPQHLLPAVMTQLAGVAIIEVCRAKLIAAVETECVARIEADLRDFEKENFAVLRKHKAV